MGSVWLSEVITVPSASGLPDSMSSSFTLFR